MEKKCIDLAVLSEEIGCEFQNVEVAKDVVIRQTHWNKEQYAAARERIREELEKNPEGALIYGSPDPWNTVGLIQELGDLGLGYAYPKPGHPEMVALDLRPLPIGTPEYNYDVQYEIREEDDRIYVNLTSDNPDLPRPAGTPHTFTIANTTKVSVPPLTPGKDVYIHAWGMYGVMCSVAATIAVTARSVFLASHDTDYYCCATKTPLHAIGDVEKRTTENPLPHC